MTPGTPTGPGEGAESAEKIKPRVVVSKSDQVTHTNNYCDKLRKEDPEMRELIKEFHQGTKTKDNLRELFEKKFKGASSDIKIHCGVEDGADGFERFLRETKCFENQFFYGVERDKKLRDEAREELLTACIDTVLDEYALTDEQKEALKKALGDIKKEDVKSLQIFLNSSKHRRKRLKEYLPSELVEKKLSHEIDFERVHNGICNANPTIDPKVVSSIRAAWQTMMGGVEIREVKDPATGIMRQETVQEAFMRMNEEGTGGNIAAAYEVFFSDKNTIVSKENRKKILDFLVRQYVPIARLENIEAVNPNAAKKIIEDNKIPTKTDGISDTEWKTALETQQKEKNKAERRAELGRVQVATKHLDDETKLRLLSTFGGQKRAQQIQDFWQGKPGAMSDENYAKNFNTTYGFHPEEVESHAGLIKRLEVHLGTKIDNTEKFAPGHIMTWRTKRADGTEMVGYYAIDEILEDKESREPSENTIKVRFLGNNTPEKDEEGRSVPPKINLNGGLPFYYSGSRFFEYLSGCSDEGKINFHSEGEMEGVFSEDKVKTLTEEDAKQHLREQYEHTEIVDEETFHKKVDEILYVGANKDLESGTESERKIRSGMVFAIANDKKGLDTFVVEDFVPPAEGEPGLVKLWDGWGTGKKSRMEMSLPDFINILKSKKNIYRVPFGKENQGFDIQQFNTLMQSEKHNGNDAHGGGEPRHLAYQRISIKEDEHGHLGLFESDKSGGSQHKTIVKVGKKGSNKDLYIKEIHGDTVILRIGSFHQTKFDSKTGKFTQQPTFKGSGELKMPLSWLWGYIQSNDCTFDKEDRDAKMKEQKGSDGSMSWLNVFKHAHSLGVILHGDLWKAPFKAWEEQHHKDHAFAGKLTAALAMEKLQNGSYGPISSFLNYTEFPSLMVGDGSTTIQNYLDELVNKVDGMSSVHRTRLIKKWAKNEHFPSPKFMAAMFSSMMIFGQLYPYDDGDKDVRAQEWFWYNSITHTKSVKMPKGGKPEQSWPEHMPPHDPKDWPKDKEGNPVSEIEACMELFASFRHPLLTNLRRRFQKYMTKGHDQLKDGGPSNLEERTGVEMKLEWMMDAVCHSKPTEAFGTASEIWLKEGYPTAISTMPYAALLFGSREQQLLPKTQEHLKKQFQDEGIHIPMMVFAQNKALGDTFRETGIAFAYTISLEAGEKLEKLVNMTKDRRLNGSTRGKWRSGFEDFWREYGKEMMHKLSGMRDPMLNLMINAPETFQEMLDSMTGDEKKKYERIREKRGAIVGYHQRLKDTYDSPSHVHMDRGKGFYSGDHFRFRDFFNIGYPMAWVNWDAYWDANMDKNYSKGADPTAGDGIFNEIRGFLYKIPEMAGDMCDQMGYKEGHPRRKEFISKISEKLFKRNVEPMRRLAGQKIDATTPKTFYCSVTAQFFGIIEVQKMSVSGGADRDRYEDYFVKMKAVKDEAERIDQAYGFAEGIKYRQDMSMKWQKIIEGQIDVQKNSIQDIKDGNYGGVSKTRKKTTEATMEKKKAETEAVLRGGLPREQDRTTSKHQARSEELGGVKEVVSGDEQQ